MRSFVLAAILVIAPGCSFAECDTAFGSAATFDFGTTVDLIAVGPGRASEEYVALGLNGLVSVATSAAANPQSPVNVTLRGVAQSGERLIVVGDQGTILVSDDGGSSWTPRTSNVTTSLTAVVHAGLAGGIWEVALGVETIVVSTDAGETWTPVVEPALGWGTLRGGFVTEARVYAIGDGGVAWSSAMAPGQWNAESIGTNANLIGGGASQAGYAPAESRTLLLAAADASVVIRNPGGSWQVGALAVEGQPLAFSGGYLLTDTGVVYDLDDTGLAARVDIDLDFEARAIHADALGVVVVGEQGQAARTHVGSCVGLGG